MTTGPISLRQDWQHTDGKAHMRLVDAYDAVEGVTKLAMLVWDTNTLAWVRYTPVGGAGGGGDASAANQTTEIARLTSISGKLPSIMSAAPGSDTGQDAIPVRVVSQLGAGTGGGGGGAATIADGADVTQGAKADSAWDLAAPAPTTMGVFKKIAGLLDSIRVAVAGTLVTTTTQLPASLGANGGVKVEGVAGGVAVPVSNAALTSLDTKLPAPGQALAAGSLPVVLTAAQQAALTPPAAIAGFALESGHLAAIDTATARLPAQGQALAAGSLPVVLTAAQITTLTPPAAITGYALDSTVAKDGTDISAPTAMPAGGVGIRGWLSAIWTKLNGTITVSNGQTQPLTDTQLRASAVPVSNTQLPAALAAGGGLKVEGVVGGVAVPVSLATNAPDVTDRAGRLLGVTSNANIDVALSTRLKPADTLAAVTNLAQLAGTAPVMKAASTAAAAADAALVVGLSPNSPVPAGTNVIGGVTGDVDHDAVNTLKTLQVGGYASPVDVPPSAVSANGDRARIWVDRFGATIVRRRKIRESYTAVFRLAETAARLDGAGFTQVANTNKQWATIYHAAAATKEVRLQYCIVYIESWSIASQAVLEIRELTGATAPATGNPAITPKPRRVGGNAAEATCLYLPGTAGTETAVNSPIKSFFLDEGIMGAVSTVNPLPLQGITLYSSSQEDDEMLPPTLPVGVAGGWAVMLRTVGAPVVRLVCEMGFTEEIP